MTLNHYKYLTTDDPLYLAFFPRVRLEKGVARRYQNKNLTCTLLVLPTGAAVSEGSTATFFLPPITAAALVCQITREQLVKMMIKIVSYT